MHVFRPLRPALLLVLLSGVAPAPGQQAGPPQGGDAAGARGDGVPAGRGGAGVDREAMWWAPTKDDWGRPVLVTFQRTWEDAVALSGQTGRPILVCVNMDGEIASEHYAGVRYRQPEIAALYEPYVCVIASVYRHNPRDFDEQGRRLLCPRFGSVTCGEHIAIEPLLFERFFDGVRVAPRHIMVELDGEETYDVYYAWDTDSVFASIRTGIEQREAPPQVVVRGDRPLLERVASPDGADRQAVEQAYLEGDREQRQALLSAATTLGEEAPPGLLRLAVTGLDAELARLGRAALAQSSDPAAIDLITESLAVPLPEDEREALVGALERLGAQSPRARTIAAVQRGLTGGTSVVDVAGWSGALGGDEAAAAAARDSYARAALLERQDEVLASADAESQLLLAEAFLEQAYEQHALDDDDARLLLMDARAAAEQAAAAGASGWRLDAVRAIASWYLGERQQARTFAEAAVVQGGIPADADGWNSMAVLAIFAGARQEQIREKVAAKEGWPPQWLADVHAACSVLARHPHGTPDQLVAHHDFLAALGGAGRARDVLEHGLARWPGSAALHERFRGQVLRERGAEGLGPAYDELLQRLGEQPALLGYAGEAALVAAEFHRRAGRDDPALAAYAGALSLFDRDVASDPGRADWSDEGAALALAGSSRLLLERGDLDGATGQLLAALGRRPEAAAVLDGMNLSPADTVRTLRARLAEAEEGELLRRLEDGLAAIDPSLLRLAAYESGAPDPDAERRNRDRGEP